MVEKFTIQRIASKRWSSNGVEKEVFSTQQKDDLTSLPTVAEHATRQQEFADQLEMVQTQP